MKQTAVKLTSINQFVNKYGYIMLVFVSLIALLFTFIIAILDLALNTKILAFALITVSHLFVYTLIRLQQNEYLVESTEIDEAGDSSEEIFDEETVEKLVVLEEAGKFFSASLKSTDMFRLISSRIGEIIPFTSCAFFVLDEQNKFYVPFATGKNSRLLESLRIECSDGLAGKSFLSCQIERDKNLTFDKRGITREFLSGLASAMSVPLFKDDEVFCVLVIYSDVRDNYRTNDEKLLEAIGERITPLIIGSYSFEKNLSNAMTDSITSLPNERAFYMMLESRVAEAQRFQEQQNLTVLAIDIKNFAEINEKYGHAAGDRMLVFAAKTIQYQLRRMDLVARMNKDEFLVVLPTANDIITDRIVERIESAFLDEPFAVTEEQKIYIELCFGSATFQDDGDTAEKLMNTALIRKHQSKSNGQSSVVFFPKQYVN